MSALQHMVIPRFLLMSTEEREAVLRAYYELEGLIYLENKCAYTAMYLFLKISKWIAKISYEAAKKRIKHILAPCFNLPCLRTECAVDPALEDCIIAWLLMGKKTKDAKKLALQNNIYGEIAQYLLGGPFPSSCTHDLKRVLCIMHPKHRAELRIAVDCD